MELTWLGEAEARGEVRGREQERAQNLEQMRRAVLRGLAQRFGPVPERVQKSIQETDSVESLVEMVERLPVLESVDDLVAHRRGSG